MAHRSPATIVLESMLLGIPVKMGDRVYALSEDNKLVFEGVRENGESLWLLVDLIGDCLPILIKLANELPEHELFLVSARIASERKLK